MQQKILSQGDKVCIRSHDGEFIERIVWDSRDECVLVCSERQFGWLKRGDYRAAPIGFSWKDVYTVSEAEQ